MESWKQIRVLCDKKNKYPHSRDFLNETKNHTPCKLNVRSLNAFLKASFKMIPDGIDGMDHFLHGFNSIFFIDFRSSLMFSQFAFLYNGISRGFCFALCGLMSSSVNTISWSRPYYEMKNSNRNYWVISHSF